MDGSTRLECWTGLVERFRKAAKSSPAAYVIRWTDGTTSFYRLDDAHTILFDPMAAVYGQASLVSPEPLDDRAELGLMVVREGVAPSPLETPVLPRLSFDDEEYSLHREAFERFSIIFGPFTWDLFAPAHNAQCPTFFTWETNALAQEWARLGNLWAHPPCCLVDSVVGKLEAEPRALVTMITPHWPKAPWFPRLQHLATYQEVLGRHEGLFTDSRGRPMPAPHWDVLLSHVPRRMQGSD
eukprot:scaffold763_cov403-Pavlova_lutheri.AAC.1